MSVETSLSCFDCPALNTINRELGNMQFLRDFALTNSVKAMEQSEQASRADDIQEPLTATKNTCVNIFTLLDRSEALLQQARVDLEETCTPGKPYTTNEPALLGRQFIQCSSEMAVDLAPGYCSEILPDSE